MSLYRRVAALILPTVALLAACDDSTDPNGLDPADLVGTFVLDPSIDATCSLGTAGSLHITVDTVEVTDASEDSVYVRIPFTASTFLGDMTHDAEFALALDIEDGTFGGDHTLDIVVPGGVATLYADGSMSLDGTFEDEDSFEADIESDIAVTVGDGTPRDCSAVDLTVTGTRD